jgi:hypothetical protein
MRKEIIGCTYVILIFLAIATQGVAQTQPSPVPAPRPPRPPSPAAPTYCIFGGTQYSIGAAFCISSQLVVFCSAPNADHSAPWWNDDPQPLCTEAAPAPAPTVPAPTAPVLTPPAPAESLVPRTKP